MIAINEKDYNKYIKKLGKKIKALRENKGLSQEKMSFDVGIHRNYLSEVELGKKNASIKTLFYISKVLEVDLSELLNLK